MTTTIDCRVYGFYGKDYPRSILYIETFDIDHYVCHFDPNKEDLPMGYLLVYEHTTPVIHGWKPVYRSPLGEGTPALDGYWYTHRDWVTQGSRLLEILTPNESNRHMDGETFFKEAIEKLTAERLIRREQEVVDQREVAALRTR